MKIKIQYLQFSTFCGWYRQSPAATRPAWQRSTTATFTSPFDLLRYEIYYDTANKIQKSWVIWRFDFIDTLHLEIGCWNVKTHTTDELTRYPAFNYRNNLKITLYFHTTVQKSWKSAESKSCGRLMAADSRHAMPQLERRTHQWYDVVWSVTQVSASRRNAGDGGRLRQAVVADCRRRMLAQSHADIGTQGHTVWIWCALELAASGVCGEVEICDHSSLPRRSV